MVLHITLQFCITTDHYFICLVGAAKFSRGIVTAAQILGDSIELKRTDCFIRLDILGQRKTKRNQVLPNYKNCFPEAAKACMHDMTNVFMSKAPYD